MAKTPKPLGRWPDQRRRRSDRLCRRSDLRRRRLSTHGRLRQRHFWPDDHVFSLLMTSTCADGPDKKPSAYRLFRNKSFQAGRKLLFTFFFETTQRSRYLFKLLKKNTTEVTNFVDEFPCSFVGFPSEDIQVTNFSLCKVCFLPLLVARFALGCFFTSPLTLLRAQPSNAPRILQGARCFASPRYTH
jgi:hypothetical protein